MTTNRTHSVAQKVSTVFTSSLAVKLTTCVLVAGVLGNAFGLGSAAATDLEVNELVGMVQSGAGQVAVQQVAEIAWQRGAWAPAPEDEVVFDSTLSSQIRGASLDYDEPPAVCLDDKLVPDVEGCLAQFRLQERQVRFGRSLFTDPIPGVQPVPRPAFDDLLSTYIEEVGHSWQEYQYETNGAGSGARARQTTLAEAERWGPGREYQIKLYILSLDGSLLALSSEQHAMLREQICAGYANPLGHELPAYGAPANWPNPAGWPVSMPTPQAFEAFCTSS